MVFFNSASFLKFKLIYINKTEYVLCTNSYAMGVM